MRDGADLEGWAVLRRKVSGGGRPRSTFFSSCLMGSDSSKPVAPKAPTDPDPVGTRTFSDSFPEPGTYEAFCVRYYFVRISNSWFSTLTLFSSIVAYRFACQGPVGSARGPPAR